MSCNPWRPFRKNQEPLHKNECEQYEAAILKQIPKIIKHEKTTILHNVKKKYKKLQDDIIINAMENFIFHIVKFDCGHYTNPAENVILFHDGTSKYAKDIFGSFTFITDISNLITGVASGKKSSNYDLLSFDFQILDDSTFKFIKKSYEIVGLDSIDSTMRLRNNWEFLKKFLVLASNKNGLKECPNMKNFKNTTYNPHTFTFACVENNWIRCNSCYKNFNIKDLEKLIWQEEYAINMASLTIKKSKVNIDSNEIFEAPRD